MGGKFICPEYKRRWILELKSDPIEDVDKKHSRYWFTRDLPYWHYPPFCRYGYECKACIQIRMLWSHCCADDFEEVYHQVISGSIQLTLF